MIWEGKTRPWPYRILRAYINHRVAVLAEELPAGIDRAPHDEYLGLLLKVEELVAEPGEHKKLIEAKRHTVIRMLIGQLSMDHMIVAEMVILEKWARTPEAKAEIRAMLVEDSWRFGQQPLPEPPPEPDPTPEPTQAGLFDQPAHAEIVPPKPYDPMGRGHGWRGAGWYIADATADHVPLLVGERNDEERAHEIARAHSEVPPVLCLTSVKLDTAITAWRIMLQNKGLI